MKNLQNYDVHELSIIEQKKIDGGLFGLDDLIIGAALLVVGDIINNWDDFKTGISGGY